MLGYISYPIRAFVQNTLLCFRYQAYGHVAAVCRREIPRCAEGHWTNKCVVSVKEVNYRGALVAGDKKCPVRERQVEVDSVRVVQKMSYTEAVKKVEEDGLRVRYPKRLPVSSRPLPVRMKCNSVKLAF
jgi:hypothetical protein